MDITKSQKVAVALDILLTEADRGQGMPDIVDWLRERSWDAMAASDLEDCRTDEHLARKARALAALADWLEGA